MKEEENFENYIKKLETEKLFNEVKELKERTELESTAKLFLSITIIIMIIAIIIGVFIAYQFVKAITFLQ